MKEQIRKITEAELEVLRVLWKEEELPFARIRSQLEENTRWELSTIKTLLRRLCIKDIVKVEKREVFYYKALICEEEYNCLSIESFIDRVFLGSAKNLIASLVDSKKLSKKDIEELRAMLKDGDEDDD